MYSSVELHELDLSEYRFEWKPLPKHLMITRTQVKDINTIVQALELTHNNLTKMWTNLKKKEVACNQWDHMWRFTNKKFHFKSRAFTKRQAERKQKMIFWNFMENAIMQREAEIYIISKYICYLKEKIMLRKGLK